MTTKKWVTRAVLLAVVAAGLCAASKPAAANTATYTPHFTCYEAQRAVNYLLFLDEVIENSQYVSAEDKAEADQWIANEIKFIEQNTVGACTFNSDDE